MEAENDPTDELIIIAGIAECEGKINVSNTVEGNGGKALRDFDGNGGFNHNYHEWERGLNDEVTRT